MPSASDPYQKEFLCKVLGATIATTEIEHEVETPAQSIDVIAVPKPEVDRRRAFAKLGYLARMVERPCLFEPYSRAPGAAELRACMRKQLAWDNERVREAERRQTRAPEFPFLWILSPGDPKTVTIGYGFEAREGWPHAFRFAPPEYAAGLVIISKLERTRATLFLRLLGSGRVLKGAIEDVRELPDPTLGPVIVELLVRRRILLLQSTDPEDRKVAMMLEQEFQRLKKEMREEGRQEGHKEGHKEGRRDLLRRQLTKKFGPLDAATVARLDAADDALLDTYADRILTATKLSDVLGE